MMITAVSIRYQNLLYEVTWWDGATKKTDWFNTEELIVDEPVRGEDLFILRVPDQRAHLGFSLDRLD